MGLGNEALLMVRAGLCDRIDGIAAGLNHLSSVRLYDHVDAVRRVALDHGFLPLAQLSRGLEAALAAGERGVMVLGYLDLMRDAAACERLDAQASEAYLAAISVRLAG